MNALLFGLNVLGGIFFGILGATAFGQWGKGLFPGCGGGWSGVVVFCARVLLGFGGAVLLRGIKGRSVSGADA